MTESVSSHPNTGSRGRPPIVGREREQAILQRALDAMQAGHGSLVLVSGEAGIGKTTLVEDLAVQAEERGCLVLWGHAYDLSVTPPYGPWLEIFRRYGSVADDALPPVPAYVFNAEELARVGSQESLFVALAEFLAAVAAKRPLVLVVDDLHWADQASLDFLRFMARQLSNQRLLLIGIYRSDELTRGHPLSILLPLLVREAGAVRLQLRPLDEVGQRALIQSRYQLAAADQARLEQYLVIRAEGNPLYAGEILRAMEEERILAERESDWQLGDPERARLPSLLMQVIERRLARLSAETRGLLQVAAVIGQEVSLDLWQQVSDASDETLSSAIEEGQAAHLIEEIPASGGYRFRHALLREALYQEVVAVHRRIWHRRVAEALVDTSAPDPDRVAYHFRQAGDRRTAGWLCKAGERAQRSYAWATAIERFDAALTKLTEHEAPSLERAILLYRIAFLLRYSDIPRALAVVDDARQLAIDAKEEGIACLCLVLSGLMQCFNGNVQAGLGLLEQGTRALGALPETDRVRALSLLDVDGNVPASEATLIMWLALAGHLEEARARGLQLAATVREPVLRPGRAASDYADLQHGLAIAEALLGYPEAALSAFERGLVAFGATANHTIVAVGCTVELQLALLPYFPERLEARARLADVAVQAGHRAVEAVHGVHAEMWVLPLLTLEGAWMDAREVAEWAYGTPSPWRVVFAGQELARLAAKQGDHRVAQEVIAELFPDGPSTEPGNAVLWQLLPLQRLAAEIALTNQDSPTARAWLEAHDRWLDWSGAVLGRAEGALLWGHYHHARGDVARTRRSTEQALALATNPRQPLVLIAVYRFLGMLNTEELQFDAAEEHLQQSLALAEACAAPFERALTLLESAELCGRQRRYGDATALLDEVQSTCEPLEARPTLERVAALRERFKRAANMSPSYPAGLSPREVEVLRLVAEGLTDAEIAETLFLSRRTVNAHLRSVYNKIGISSRAAAARFATQHKLI